MDVVTLDFETYYTTEYSLSRMSEVEYILSPLFQSIMCSIKFNDEETKVYVGFAAIAKRLAEFDWTKTAMCSHNLRFDGAIAAWLYGIHPVLYLDTLGMARATVYAVTKKASLAAVSKYLGLPDKGDEVVRARGKRLEDFTLDELTAYADYCRGDTDNCRSIFTRLLPHIPRPELYLIDTILRMFIEPQVTLDPNVLATHLGQVRADKAAVMAQVSHLDKSVFSSNAKFAALLQEHGVVVPQKVSPATGELTWALAKGDRDFKELCQDPDQPLAVQALLAARTNVKSTIEETRTEALLNLSLRQWPPGYLPGVAPIPIKPYGAHTGRMSGDGGFNWQNFRRGSPIHDAHVAPAGMRIVHRDASQIEVRMLAALARCERLLQAFREKRDIYSEFATKIYRRHVDKSDKTGRFVGKTCILGLGYQTGGPKLRHTLFIGNGGQSVTVSEQEAWSYVQAYRKEFQEIPRLWAEGETIIKNMLTMGRGTGSGPLHPVGYPVISYNERAIWLPNKMALQYPNMHREGDDIVYDRGHGFTNIYGGKLTENVDQALSRIIVTDIAERVHRQTGHRPFLARHDSLDYCVPEATAKDFDALLEYEFSLPPTWLQTIPLASEGGWGRTLGAAERGENT